MNRHPIITMLVLGCMACTATAGRITPMYVRDVRLENIPLKQGERIAAIEVTIVNAAVSKVSVPLGWRADVSWPDARCGTTVTAEAGHGIACLDDGKEFGEILTLAFYKEWGHDRFEKDQDVKIAIITEDPDASRTNSVPAKCIILSAPRQKQISAGE
jgi:hypothetical protein